MVNGSLNGDDNINNEANTNHNDKIEQKDAAEADFKPSNEQMTQFEVPSSETKVEFNFANNGNEFHISSAQQAFNNIVGSKGIVKLTYSSKNVQYNNVGGDDADGQYDLMIVLKHVIITVALDKHKDKSKSDHYYKTIVYKFKKCRITTANEFNLMYN